MHELRLLSSFSVIVFTLASGCLNVEFYEMIS